MFIWSTTCLFVGIKLIHQGKSLGVIIEIKIYKTYVYWVWQARLVYIAVSVNGWVRFKWGFNIKYGGTCNVEWYMAEGYM